MMRKRTWFIIVAIIFFAMVLLLYSKTRSSDWEDYELNLRMRNLLYLEDTIGFAKKKKVLLWNSIFGDNWFYMGKSGHFDHCPRYNNCFATRDRGLISVSEFDAILFHGNDLSREDLPETRDPGQAYVYVNLESPVNRPIVDHFFEDYFNLTMTYRLDSDIPWPYDIVRNIETGEVVAPFDKVEWLEPSYDVLNRKLVELKIGKKSKMVAWLVSNCNTPGKRELFVDDLSKYIQVEIMGLCGKTDGKPGNEKCPRTKNTCFEEIIEPEYFFYLSFENTLCNDYVTEKFFQALRYYVIPVVYGGANYSLFAPPYSYIDALDFESPKALANYLEELSTNQDEYLKYFWWKRFYNLDHPHSWTACRLCELINEQKSRKTYSPLSGWFTEDECPFHQSDNKPLTFATKHSKISNDFEKNTTNI